VPSGADLSPRNRGSGRFRQGSLKPLAAAFRVGWVRCLKPCSCLTSKRSDIEMEGGALLHDLRQRGAAALTGEQLVGRYYASR
jgi:hypothetical protein